MEAGHDPFHVAAEPKPPQEPEPPNLPPLRLPRMNSSSSLSRLSPSLSRPTSTTRILGTGVSIAAALSGPSPAATIASLTASIVIDPETDRAVRTHHRRDSESDYSSHDDAASPAPASVAASSSAVSSSGAGTGLHRLDTQHHVRVRTGTVASSVFTLSNSIIGSTTLVLPWAARQAGLGMAVLLLAGGLVFTFVSLQLLYLAAKYSDHGTFADLTRAVVHKHTGDHELAARAVRGVKTLILISAFGGVVGNLVLVTDFLTAVAQSWLEPTNVFTTRGGVLAAVAVALLPLVNLQSISALRYTAFLAVVCVVFFTLSVCFRLSTPTPELRESTATASFPFFGSVVGVIRAVPVAAAAFSCAVNYPSIASELMRPTEAKVRTYTMAALGIATLVYGTVCVAGFLTFGSEVSGNVLNSYPRNDELMRVARLLEAVVIMCAAPLNVFPAKRMLAKLLSPHKPLSLAYHRALGTGVFMAAVVIASLTRNVQVVISITGSVITPTIQYILPALFFYTLVPTDLAGRQDLRVYRTLSKIVGVFGALFVVVCSSVTLAFLGQKK